LRNSLNLTWRSIILRIRPTPKHYPSMQQAMKP
jgi:hypothetical protein